MVHLATYFDRLLCDLLAACQRHYGDRLVSMAIFGSVGRGTPRPDSDLDVLIVAEGLPSGRMARIADFAPVERALSLRLAEGRPYAPATDVCPVFKSPAEVERGSPLFLDMIDDARILWDRDQFLAMAFARLRARLNSLGARRIWRGNAWFWDLKPDYRLGEVFDL